MKSGKAIGLAALLMSCSTSPADSFVLDSLPDAIVQVVVVRIGDGNLVATPFLERPADSVLPRPPGAPTDELWVLGFTAPELEELIVSAGDQLGVEPLTESAPGAPFILTPAWVQQAPRGVGVAFVDRPPPFLLTASWLPKCLLPSLPRSSLVDTTCVDLPCRIDATVEVSACAVTLDVGSCVSRPIRGDIDGRGALNLDDEGPFQSCQPVAPVDGAQVAAACGDCRVDIFEEAPVRTADVRVLPIVDSAMRAIRPRSARHSDGLLRGLTVLDGEIIVSHETGGVLATERRTLERADGTEVACRDAPPGRVVFVDFETMSITRTATVVACIHTLTAEPTTGGFYASFWDDSAWLGYFDRQARLIRRVPIETPLTSAVPELILDTVVVESGRVVVLVSSLLEINVAMETVHLIAFDRVTMENRRISGVLSRGIESFDVFNSNTIVALDRDEHSILLFEADGLAPTDGFNIQNICGRSVNGRDFIVRSRQLLVTSVDQGGALFTIDLDRRTCTTAALFERVLDLRYLASGNDGRVWIYGVDPLTAGALVLAAPDTSRLLPGLLAVGRGPAMGLVATQFGLVLGLADTGELVRVVPTDAVSR